MAPNAPPTSGAITRIESSGRPSTALRRAARPKRRLGRAPDSESVRLAIVVGGDGARLHRHLRQSAVLEPQLEAALTVGQIAPDVASAARDGVGQVGAELREQQRRLGRQRLFGGRDRRQRLVLDVDQVHRIAGQVACRRDHRCQRIADHARPRPRPAAAAARGGAAGRRGRCWECAERSARPRRSRPSSTPGAALGRLDVDTRDARMGVGGSQERHVGNVVELQIIDVLPLAAQQSGVFNALAVAANFRGGHACRKRRYPTSAPAETDDVPPARLPKPARCDLCACRKGRYAACALAETGEVRPVRLPKATICDLRACRNQRSPAFVCASQDRHHDAPRIFRRWAPPREVSHASDPLTAQGVTRGVFTKCHGRTGASVSALAQHTGRHGKCLRVPAGVSKERRMQRVRRKLTHMPRRASRETTHRALHASHEASRAGELVGRRLAYHTGRHANRLAQHGKASHEAPSPPGAKPCPLAPPTAADLCFSPHPAQAHDLPLLRGRAPRAHLTVRLSAAAQPVPLPRVRNVLRRFASRPTGGGRWRSRRPILKPRRCSASRAASSSKASSTCRPPTWRASSAS